MRFHIGCSFRPKNLLKFIFPFLLGVLVFFGYDKVFALENYNSSYNIILENKEDFLDQTIPGLNYSISTLNEYLSSYSDNGFDYFSFITSSDYYFVYWTSSSCPYTELKLDLYGYSSTTFSWFDYSLNSTNNPGCKVDRVPFSLYFGSSNQSTLNNLIYKFNHLSSVDYRDITDYSSILRNTIFNNNDSFEISDNIDPDYNSFLYDTNTTIAYNRCSSGLCNDSNYFFKNILINGMEIPNNTQFPSYLQLLEMQGQFNTYYYRLPYNYFSMNKSDISSFNAKLKYTPVINANDYVNLVTGGELNFYGRYNHNNNYYTYEQINCTLSRISNINSNTNQISVNYSNLSCSSDLTNYDKIYIYESFKYDYDTIGHYDLSVSNINLTSNVDSFTSNEYKGNLYEPLILQNGFKILISSNSQNKVNYISNNDYLSFNKLSNEDITHIDNTISGVEIGYNHIKSGGRLPSFYSFNVGTYDQSMYYLYDNYTLHSPTQTDLKLFYENPSSTMLSFPIVINGQDTFNYYNNEGNVTNGTTIQTNYGDIGGNYSQQEILDTSLFDPINNFLDDIEEDLISMHELNQTIFDNIPAFIKTFIVVIYSLFLLSILFKEVKR